MIITCGRLITGTDDFSPGWMHVDADRVKAVGAGQAPGRADVDLGDVTVAPGFVDTHVHGGGGHSFMDPDPATAAQAVACHTAHGTTSLLASLVSAEIEELAARIEGLADLVEEGLLNGVHLEGPWLSPSYRGAHDPDALRVPEPADIDRLLGMGRSAVRMVTLAPELDGGIDAIRRIVAHGRVAAIGHTAATYELARAALHAGATVGTHLMNAMAPMHHRCPGPALAIMEERSALGELIADGVHVHPAMLRSMANQLGPERTILVTDAMAASCCVDGHYRLGKMDVVVADGVARLEDSGVLAGSTLTMDAAVRCLVHEAGLPLLFAIQAATRNPARAARIDRVGQLQPGSKADAVVLDTDLHVVGTMKAGSWVDIPGQGRPQDA